MFTPQRKAPWTPATQTPRPTPRHLQTPSIKGKTVAFLDGPPPPPPPTSSISVSESPGFDDGSLEDWRKFKEVGLLDESALEMKDRQAMLDKVSRLQQELFDYQYNMGLLLMEKKNLVSKTEELEQEVSEAEEILKRERAAHLIAVSEAEKREENLKKALQMERQTLVDLERALRDVTEEHAKSKATSETTVADVNARMEEFRTLNLDVEKRSHAVDAKLAESDRKISELGRMLQDLEVRENILQREQLSLTQERESHELNLRKQKEDLLEWERKLQEGEQRLYENRRILNEREEKLHGIDISSKVKESNIEELQKKIDLANETLKKVEDDVKNQLVDLDMKEKEAEAIRCELKARETQLQKEEERLNVREKVELERLVNEHKVLLDAKMHEFDLDMKQKETAIEEELKSRKEAVVLKETEINHLELKLGKRELALEKKSERLKDKENDFDVKNRTLKEQEKCLKAEVKRLEAEKKQVTAEKENLEILREEIETLRNDVRKQELHIEEELKNLENAEKERLEYLRLQSSLKQEIENVRCQSELIEKEAADLMLEREKFEKDWEALDEKQSTVDNELKILAEKKTSFEKSRNFEEERLNRERAENEEHIRLESESIRLQKESFEAMMKQEKLILAEEAANQQALMHQDFEQQKQELYNDMQKRWEERERVVEEKERALEELRLRELSYFNKLKEDVEKNREEMEIEWRHMEKEKEELESNKKQFEETRVEISKDIKALDNLSRMLKKQREQLFSERAHFGALIERIKCCKDCGDSVQAFICDIQLPTVEGSSHFPRVNKAPQFGGQRNVFQKFASTIFNLSPKMGFQHADNHVMEESPQSATHMQAIEHVREQSSIADKVNGRTDTSPIEELEPAFDKVYDAITMSQSNFRDENADNSVTVYEFDNGSEVQGIEEPEKSGLKNGRRKSGRTRGPGVRRTHSVKAVVEEAKVILRDGSADKMEAKPNDSVGVNVNNKEANFHAKMTPATSARKRSRSQASKVTESEQDVEQSEGNADSVTTDRRKKKKQTEAPSLPTPGQSRYYLRRHTAAASSGKPENEGEVSHKSTKAAAPSPDETPAQSLDIAVESDRRLHLVQVSTTRSVEFTSDNRRIAAAKVADNPVDTAKSTDNPSLVEVKTAEDTLVSEVNGTSENVGDDNRSMVNENEDDNDEYGTDGEMVDRDVEDEDEDEDTEEDEHPGQASVGKKLWKFFTS